MSPAFFSELFIKSCKIEGKELREEVHPGQDENLNRGSQEWLLTTTLCHIYL